MVPDPKRPLKSVPTPPDPELAALALEPLAFPTLASAAPKLSKNPVIPVLGEPDIIHVNGIFPLLSAFERGCGLQKTQPNIWIKIATIIQFIVIAIRILFTTDLAVPMNNAFYNQNFHSNTPQCKRCVKLSIDIAE